MLNFLFPNHGIFFFYPFWNNFKGPPFVSTLEFCKPAICGHSIAIDTVSNQHRLACVEINFPF